VLIINESSEKRYNYKEYAKRIYIIIYKIIYAKRIYYNEYLKHIFIAAKELLCQSEY